MLSHKFFECGEETKLRRASNKNDFALWWVNTERHTLLINCDCVVMLSHSIISLSSNHHLRLLILLLLCSLEDTLAVKIVPWPTQTNMAKGNSSQCSINTTNSWTTKPSSLLMNWTWNHHRMRITRKKGSFVNYAALYVHPISKNHDLESQRERLSWIHIKSSRIC